VRSLSALRALWFGLVDPRRVQEVIPDTAVAVFATAVLVLSLTMTAGTLLEGGDPLLLAESSTLTGSAATMLTQGDVDLTSPQRQFTAVYGGALISAIVGIAALAGMFWILARFMTDQPLTFSMSLASVGATALIEVVKALVMTPLHLLTHTNRIGLHAGVFLDPSSHPYLFAWLQRFDAFNLWQYLAAAVILATWTGLHHRYGVVIGSVVFVIVQLLFGGMTVVAWILSQAS